MDPQTSFTVPEHVLKRDADGESVVLNLKTEEYHGLNTSGRQFWHEITSTSNLESAHTALLAHFAVDPEQLRADLTSFVETLVAKGLLDVVPNSAK